MSGEPFLSVGGVIAQSVRLVGPWTGLWGAQVCFAEQTPMPVGPVEVVMGDLRLIGVVDPTRSGDFALSSEWTLIGGFGGWRTIVTPNQLHNDAGATRNKVLADVAATVGERVLVLDAELGAGVVGPDYLRMAGEASSALELLFPSTPWWVAADGTTMVGDRVLRDVTGAVQLLEAHPTLDIAELAADDPTDLLPGCWFTDDRLPGGAFVIHDVEFIAAGGKARATAWSSDQRDGMLAGLVAQLARRAFPRQLYAYPYRYRVVTLAGDRVNLQYVPNPNSPKPKALPNALAIGIAPGMAGLSAELALSSLVLVEFVEGDPSQPIITHFGRKDEPGFLPVQVALNASSIVTVGADAASVRVAGVENANALTAVGEKRFVQWGDVAVGPVSLGAPLTLIPTGTGTMSKAGRVPP